MPTYPPTFPHDLQKKPKLVGESLVYAALKAALPASWHIFYDWPVRGTRRRIDFLCIDPERGAAAFEIKGGLVHKKRANFVQMVNKDGMRKAISPFDQLKRGVADVLHFCGIAPAAFPMHLSIFFPTMSQSAYTFGEGQHFFTRENLHPPALWSKLERSLPATVDPASTAAMRQLVSALATKS